MYINVGGYNICYKISGEGNNYVVILQGWGTDLGVYDLISNYICEDYKVVQFDLPGFGSSDEPKEAWNVDAYTDFFCKFVQKLNIDSATLIGHSFGGRIIIKLASRDNIPFEINRIVLIDSAGIISKKNFSQNFKIKTYKILKAVFNIKIINALFPELIEDWRSRQGSEDYRNASPMMRKCMVMAVNEDLTDLLSKIKQDTLLIWGSNDTATPMKDAKIMEEKIPNSGLAVIEGTGHFSFLEQPLIFRNIIRSYLGLRI